LPTCAITSPSSGAKVSGTISITGTASDADGTVEKVEVKIDNSDWVKTTGTESWSIKLSTTSQPDGIHTIYARSYDGEDYSSEARVNIEVDNGVDGNGDPEGGNSSLPILIIFIVIILAVIIAVVLIKKWK
jgi:hypothetical protein